ncbi:hypothetical protein DTO027I6_3258 [Penicillium roqueforti]|nr:hypothetical protein CBS147337_8504 [Penicillium roqueforti]KAI3171531.1 hypothetical protein CBS147317_960 [Penicillium roqueforti]KAI3215654.1 hypothetical protein DTO027I6_3258 [Penicillium roqueforti]KAI3231710.1 hypothetical protein DTO012A7_5321 [Penicillium roqueforti]KAI3264636.1 hypothetical protein CBS147309_6574 [Penicillium roqueforti]
MSSPSTPRSTRSVSPAGDSPTIITPGQKIKVMMAAFDSDSEDDTQIAKSTDAVSKLDLGRGLVRDANTRENDLLHDSDESASADEVFRPKGRMAARLQGNSRSAETEDGNSAFARVSKAFRSEKEQGEKPQQTEPQPTPIDESSDDDLPTAGPRRKHKSTTNSPRPDNRTSQTPSRSRADSPLFVSSPGEPHDDLHTENEDTENAEEKKPRGNARFLSLVAQKRKEREEREKADAETKKAIRKVQLEQFSSQIVSGEESGADDPRSASKLSQKARQPRKASKKALDEMKQETQRMSRNMQLAHQAKTKKKITKESLFAKFNFMQPDPPVEQLAANSSSAVGSQNSSDGELHNKTKDTPHTSPVLGHLDSTKSTANSGHAQTQAKDVDMDMDTDNEGLPDPNVLMAPNQYPELFEGPSVQDVSASVPESKSDGAESKRVFRPLTQRPIRVLLSRKEVAAHQNDVDDSDSDLEVITSPGKCRGIAAFENLPTRQAQEDPSMTKLKALAHLASPTRKMASMNSAELSANLLWRARQQAAKERQERLDELRAKGVVIETAEERAAMEDDMENLVEKARKEGDEIRRLEKAAMKKANGDDDEEEDDDYVLSGSDQEGDVEADDEDDQEEENERVNGGGDLVEEEADEDDDSADDESEVAPSDAENEMPALRRKRRTLVVSDDEDDDQPQAPSTPVRAPSFVPQSVERPNFLGMGTLGDMSLGLTQAFASTLDGNGVGTQEESATIPFSLPDPGQPVPQLRKEDSEVLVPDSQPQTQDNNFIESYTQSVTRVSESPAPYAFSEYSQSQLPDPTQDEGFVFSPFDPAKRFKATPPMSTIDTVLVGQTQSPIAERKRKMLRRGRASELVQVDENNNEGDFEIDANAFNVMKKDKAAKKNHVMQYDKKTSKAKDIIDEAAEESEDEYAGLGGHSDESDGEENAVDRQMINDNSGEVVDEKQLAALNAIHDRNRDEKDVAKLMRDITTGALRRRKNVDDDFDLDDSDDELLARRREKQREFAKMRRALLADEKIGEIADNPKKAAFFKAVEDREIDDDFNIDFLEEEENGSQTETPQVPVSGEQSNDATSDGQSRKRPLEPSAEDATNRLPPRLRRTPASAMSKKPATIAEIRETLSFLTETFEYDSFQDDASLDEAEHEQGDDETPGAEEAQGDHDQPQSDNTFIKPSHPRRTRGVVVDRLALLRQASSNSATSTNSGPTNSKLAFHSGSGGEGPIGFRPPQLLRRVTSGSSSSSSSTTSNRVTKPAASGPKKGGAVNSYTAAREREREKELRIKQRSGGSNIAKLLGKHTGGGLGALDKGQWD